MLCPPRFPCGNPDPQVMVLEGGALGGEQGMKVEPSCVDQCPEERPPPLTLKFQPPEL